MLAVPDTTVYVRQYAGAELAGQVIANPTPGLTGIHLLTTCVTDAGCDFTDFDADHAAADTAGLEVLPGFRLNGAAGFDGTDLLTASWWQSRADLFDEMSAAASRSDKMLVFDMENYSGGGECNSLLDYDDDYAALTTAMASFTTALSTNSVTRIGWYPAHTKDVCARVLQDNVEVEAWTETSFTHTRNWMTNNYGYEGKAAELWENERIMRNDWPNLVRVRHGQYDDYLRDWITNLDGNTGDDNTFPVHDAVWVFDRTRDDRDNWGEAEWLTGELLNSINTGVTDYWEFQSKRENRSTANYYDADIDATQANEDERFVSWCGGARGSVACQNDANEASEGTSGDEWYYDTWNEYGHEFDSEQYYRCNSCQDNAQFSVMINVEMPDAVPPGNGLIPLIHATRGSNTKDSWALYVDSTDSYKIKLYTRATDNTEDVFETGATTALGATLQYTFGIDTATNTVYFMDGTTGLQSGPHRVRSEVFLGRWISNVSHEPDTTLYATGLRLRRVIFWNRILTSAEFTTSASGYYPWGVN